MTTSSPEPVNIIIVTLNAAEYTKKCIESVRKYTTDSPHIITVVDNGSSETTLDYLRSQPDLTLIANESNVGYGQAVLQGYESAATNLVCVLNNDIVVSPGWLNSMVKTMHQNPEIAILGPLRPAGFCIHPYLNQDTRAVLNTTRGHELPSPDEWLNRFCAPYTYKSFVKEVKSANNFGIKYLTGPPSFISTCCALINTDAANKSGGIARPKDYKWGSDDVDLSWRVSTHGYKLAITSDTYVHHFKHVSADIGRFNRNKQADKDMVKFYKEWSGVINKYLRDQISSGVNVRELLREDNWEYWYLYRLQSTIGPDKFWQGVEGVIHNKNKEIK
jgi:GT2 family glycosyltransferase